MGSPEAGSLFIGNDESGYFRRHPKTETTLRSGHLDPPQPKKLGQRPLMVSLNGHGECVGRVFVEGCGVGAVQSWGDPQMRYLSAVGGGP